MLYCLLNCFSGRLFTCAYCELTLSRQVYVYIANCLLRACGKFKLEETIFISFVILFIFFVGFVNTLICCFICTCSCYLSCHKTLITEVRLLKR